MSHNTERTVVIAWHGLPAYAARVIGATARHFDSSLSVIGAQQLESRHYLEGLVGRRVTWLDPQQRVTWSDLRVEAPAVFFYTGWAYKAFNSLAAEAKRTGSYTVCMVDNSRKSSLRQMVGKWYFRTFIRRNIDRFFVPGQSAKGLLRYFGVPENQIHEGLYGADSEIFFAGPSLAERSNEFAFVGQFIARKGIGRMIEAFGRLRGAGRQFKFVAIGEGPLRQQLLEGGFQVEPFAGSEVVANLLRKTRFLVLPSSEEHWGVVVHEAALSGCGLILSETVGSCAEFAGSQNSWRFQPGGSNALLEAMRQALDLDEQRQRECRAESLALAKHFGPRRWNQSFEEILAIGLSSQQHESPPVISAK